MKLYTIDENHATIVEQQGNIVMCKWSGDYVIWTLDKDGPVPNTVQYFKHLSLAVRAFETRVQNAREHVTHICITAAHRQYS